VSGYRSFDLLGVRVHPLSRDETVAAMVRLARTKGPHMVCSINPEMIMMAEEDPSFRGMLNSAALGIPDGMGVVWAGRMLGWEVPERVTGVDLLVALADASRSEGLRLFFLGAAPGVAHRAAMKLSQDFPGVQIVGIWDGPAGPEGDAEALRRIDAANPHMLFVAFGAPRQEAWILRNRASLRTPVAMVVGGSFDFLSGVIPRAPRWMQVTGLEWVFRLTREPARWRRMLRLPRFALYVLRNALGRRGTSGVALDSASEVVHKPSDHPLQG
jgi:N-acetylglucosaminyldiphosphoundecaprenol N-acetyl-beta-D-mannosaminyltransferase